MRIQILVALAVLALGACARTPSMSLAEAEARLNQLRTEGAEVQICTVGGAQELRDAVAVYSRAEAKEGRAWPDAAAILDGERGPDLVETAVMAAVLAGVVRPSDLAGEARPYARILTLAALTQPHGRAFRDGVAAACEDVVSLHRFIVVKRQQIARRERAIQRAMERDDRSRTRQLRERLADDHREFAVESDRIVRRIQAKIDATRAQR